ncbi:MAG: hypothetical protein EXQ52_07155 [Bryobacterales bacterium]|nr:hypothetical protein [Bryobacterales bacterium]
MDSVEKHYAGSDLDRGTADEPRLGVPSQSGNAPAPQTESEKAQVDEQDCCTNQSQREQMEGFDYGKQPLPVADGRSDRGSFAQPCGDNH